MGLVGKFRAIQIFYWCFYGAFPAFAIAYFTDAGLNAAQVGILAGGFTLGALVGQWVLGYLCDVLHTTKKVFMAAGMLSYAVIGSLFLVPKEMAIVLVLYTLLGFLQSPLATVLDAWILASFPQDPGKYGPIRAWGSLGYACFMAFFGSLIQTFGYGVSLAVAGVMMVGTLLLSVMVPDRMLSHKSEGKTGSAAELLQNKSFLFVILLGFLIGLGSSPLMQFNALYFNAVGGTLTHQGFALCVSAFMQVPLMMASYRLMHFSVKGRIAVTAFLYALCCVLIATATSPYQVIAANIFNGIGYGMCLPTMREAVLKTAPSAMATTAQGICDSLMVAVAGIVSSVFAGMLIEQMGIPAFMLVCIATQVLTILLVVLQAGAAARIGTK